MKSIANIITLGLVYKDGEEPLIPWRFWGVSYYQNEGGQYVASSIFETIVLIVFLPLTLIMAFKEWRKHKVKQI